MTQSVLITGGAKRVGEALVRYFAKAGYDVAFTYNASEMEAAALQKDIQALGRKCEIFRQDVTKISELPALMAKVKRTFPQCSVLVNNASVFERGELLQTDEALFDRQFSTNLKAPFFLTQAFAQAFDAGAVVNILDTDIVQNNVSHFSYLMSKKSLADFTKMAAIALGPQIRVHGVCPGHMLPSSEIDAMYGEKTKELMPLKSHPALDDLCEAVRWIAAQNSMTGEIIHVDGGKHLL